MSIKRLPAWFYSAIAGLLVVILAAGWTRFDAGARIELAAPALFWTGAFVIISLRRLATSR